MQRFKETMRAIQGALIIASIAHMIMGFFGLWRILVRSGEIDKKLMCCIITCGRSNLRP